MIDKTSDDVEAARAATPWHAEVSPDDATSFGRLLRAWRRARDLTQEELAGQVRYSVITIRKVEHDERRPSRQLAEQLARALAIPTDERGAFVAIARAEPGWLAPIRAYHHRASRSEGSGARTNIPTPLTRLIGRDEETRSIVRVLVQDAARLVTLGGPPGIGKSRLGLRVASSVQDRFPDGVFFVPLAPIGDPVLIAPTIAKALGVKESAGRSSLVQLVDHLRDRQVLLLLDDFDRMLSAAPFVTELLTACVGLKVLATSRAPLHVRGERLFVVPPLAVPSHGDDLSAEHVLRYPAVELFLDRAQDANPGFTLSDANAADVAALCAHLDGLPLAIELVAARTRLMAPADLVAHIGHRLALLTDGPVDLPARQQTMRGAIDWSYDLLDQAGQTLLARLSVFVGGCTLGAAEQVVNLYDDLPEPVIVGLSALVTKNLVWQERGIDGERQYVLLETIREYAHERLTASGNECEVRDRHADVYLRLAEEANADLTSHDLDRLEVARDNLHGAMEWYVRNGATESSLRLVAALWRFWHIRSRQTEGQRWICLVLDANGHHHDDLRAQALHGAGWLALDRRDHLRAYACFDESLTIFRRLHDRSGIAEALHGVGICAQARNRHAEAAVLFRESLALYRILCNDEGVAWSLDHLGDTMLNMADHELADAMFGESLAIFRRLQHAWGTAISLHHQGLAALARHDTTLADERLNESLALFQELDNTWGVATSHDHLGYAALLRGDYPRAQVHFVTALLRNHCDHDRGGFARSLTGLGSVAVRQRSHELAARFFGAAESLADGAGIEMNNVALRLYQQDNAAIRGTLNCDVVDRFRSTARGMSMDQLVELAVAVS